MKSFQDLKDELNEMYEEYKRNPIPTYTKEYHTFHKRYKALQSKIRNYYSISNRIKRAGCKVTKTGAGYMFHGNSGLKVELWSDACEAKFWTMMFVDGTAEQEREVRWESSLETKNDVLTYLFELDQK